jgi:DNA repair exonuclease SbcCD ATPase subunit
MIGRLQLKNWRNYEDVTLSFEPGTTFVVASNGVGKSSLVEAARWALFGVPGAGGSPIRMGAAQASVTVDLTLPNGRSLTVARTLKGLVPRGQPASTIILDGEAVDDGALVAILSESYGTDPAFLARLAMPAIAREQDTPESLGLDGHLGRYFGVNGLQLAVEALQVEAASIAKQIRQIKVTNAASAKQLVELADLVDAAELDAEKATAQHSSAQSALDAIRDQSRVMMLVDEWEMRRREWATKTAEIETELRDTIHAPVGSDSFEALLRERIDALSRLAEEARVVRAVSQSRSDAIRANEARLAEAHEDCPVCRRPLDEATIALAHDSNEVELSTLAAEIARNEAAAENAAAERGRLDDLLRRWRDVPRPGPEPTKPDSRISRPDDLDEATATVDAALELLVDARARAAETRRRLAEATEADEAMRKLEALFRAEAETHVALDATRATLDELLEQTVGPLASEINTRWKALFPNRGEISTRANGAISRAVGDDSLPFESFSTGEGMGALLVLRLLVAQMATTSDFCWFDEPLEHLDPDVRRQVANILSRAADGTGQLRQVVVTTYEEPLARQLQLRASDRVHLIDVRQEAWAQSQP